MKVDFLDFVRDLITYKGYGIENCSSALKYLRDCDLSSDFLKYAYEENIFFIRLRQVELKNESFKKTPFEFSDFVLSKLEKASFSEFFHFVERIHFDYRCEGCEYNSYYFLKNAGNYDLEKAKKIKKNSHLEKLFSECEILLINTHEKAWESVLLSIKNESKKD